MLKECRYVVTSLIKIRNHIMSFQSFNISFVIKLFKSYNMCTIWDYLHSIANIYELQCNKLFKNMCIERKSKLRFWVMRWNWFSGLCIDDILLETDGKVFNHRQNAYLASSRTNFVSNRWVFHKSPSKSINLPKWFLIGMFNDWIRWWSLKFPLTNKFF